MTADQVAKDIVDAAIKVHRALGPGLLESGLPGARTAKTSAPY